MRGAWKWALACALACVAEGRAAYAQPGEPEESPGYEEEYLDGSAPAGEGEGEDPAHEYEGEGGEVTGAVGEEEAPPPALAVEPDLAIRDAAKARKEELSKDAYAFCHDPEYDADGPYGDKRFCKAWDDAAKAACPEIAAVCAPDEPSAWGNFRLSLPSWLGWALLTVALLVALYFFVRSLMNRDWQSADIDLGDVVEDALAGELQALPEAPAQVILRKAAEALAGGRPEDAAILLQLACLRYFDDTGLIAFHPSRTNGEYLRAVRRRSPAHADLYRRVAGETDRIRFGTGEAARAVVEHCLEDARRLLSAPPPGEPDFARSLSVLLVAALLGASQPGCDGGDKPFYSHRPAGMSALPATLRALGLEVEIGRYALAELPPETGVVVLETSAPRELDELLLDDLMDRGVMVVVLDDAHHAEHFLPVTTATGAGSGVVVFGGVSLHLSSESPPVETVFVNDTTVCGFDLSRTDALMGNRRLQLPRGARYADRTERDARADQQPMAGTGTAAASAHPWTIAPILLVEHAPDEMVARAFVGTRVDKELGYLREGCLFLFSESDLFSNASLALPQNVAFVAALFASLTTEGKKIVLLDGLREQGSGDEGISRSVAESRLLPFILQGLLWVAVLFLFLGAAFGPLRDPVRVQHKAFVEHVEALGRQYARLGGGGLTHIARSLGKYLVMRHRGDVRGGATGWSVVSRHLAEKHGLPEEDVSTALRLGLEGSSELGPPVPDEQARSESVLRTLSILITGRARVAQAREKKRRRASSS